MSKNLIEGQIDKARRLMTLGLSTVASLYTVGILSECVSYMMPQTIKDAWRNIPGNWNEAINNHKIAELEKLGFPARSTLETETSSVPWFGGRSEDFKYNPRLSELTIHPCKEVNGKGSIAIDVRNYFPYGDEYSSGVAVTGPSCNLQRRHFLSFLPGNSL